MVSSQAIYATSVTVVYIVYVQLYNLICRFMQNTRNAICHLEHVVTLCHAQPSKLLRHYRGRALIGGVDFVTEQQKKE